MEISITLTDYEIANLINAMKMVPRNGEWYSSIICKIQTAVEESGITSEEFAKTQHPNAGMDITSVRRHLDLMEHKNKYPYLKGNNDK